MGKGVVTFKVQQLHLQVPVIWGKGEAGMKKSSDPRVETQNARGMPLRLPGAFWELTLASKPGKFLFPSQNMDSWLLKPDL